MKKLFYTAIFAAFIFALIAFKAPSAPAATVPHPPSVLINDQGTIWRISDDGKGRHAFDTVARFESHRYNFAQVVPANAADSGLANLGLIEWGQNNLVQDDAGTVWLIESKSRRGIPTPAIFYSWGGQWEKLSKASPDQIKLPVLANASYRSGAIVNDAGTIWLITNTGKKGFSQSNCFTNFDFKFSSAIVGSTNNIVAEGLLCGASNETKSNYSRQTVTTPRGNFSTDIVTVDLDSAARVITDTANDSDCSNNCAAIPLAEYVKRNNGFAGINGTYFCPPDYSSCNGQTNSFFWKIYNSRLQKMINANNGSGENDPFLAFDSTGQARWFSTYKGYKSSGFKAYAGINHKPALVENGQIAVTDSMLDDKQRTVKSTRGAIGIKGQTLYTVVGRSATVKDMAYIMHSLGVDHALNLDGGGSSAIYYHGSYKIGPGRALPNAIIFAR